MDEVGACVSRCLQNSWTSACWSAGQTSVWVGMLKPGKDMKPQFTTTRLVALAHLQSRLLGARVGEREGQAAGEDEGE